LSDGARTAVQRPLAIDVRPEETPAAAGVSHSPLAAIVLFGTGVLLSVGLAFGLLQWLPDQLSIHLLGHEVTVRAVHERLISRIVAVLLILPLALMIEFAAVGWANSSARALLLSRSPTMKTDLAIFVLGHTQLLDIVGRVMMLGLGMISAIWVRDRIRDLTGFAIDPAALPLLVQVPIYFLIYSFFDYWTHRFSHSPLIWPLHRYHHSAAEFCTLTADRQHPASFLGLFLINIPLALLGAPPAVMIFVVTLVNAFGYLQHSRMTGDWGVIGGWILQSPRHHRLHHKLSMDEPTGHYGIVPLWDRLFGTWRGTPAPDLAIGVSRPYRHGYWVVADLLRDYVDFFRGLFGRPAEP
jgi:sterol desaturase/sphingolipid hydroxylase (fatty acid hydroxylase superfamily)